MTREEKAKAYDEAYKKVAVRFGSNVADEIFPELKESEDERIRKELIEFVKSRGGFKQDYIAWLEKQGKQTSDKVEPKFKAGDWCIDNEDGTIFQIVKVLDNTYTYKTNEGKEYFCTHYSLENDARFWTIQDAKDGDVLASKDKSNILIFRNLDTSTSFSSYYNIAGKGELGWLSKCFIPATKEQRDTLFARMKEAGYEWDAEKKELKKIEQKPADEIGNYGHGKVLDALMSEIKTPEESLGIDSDTYSEIVDECIYGDTREDTAEV